MQAFLIAMFLACSSGPPVAPLEGRSAPAISSTYLDGTAFELTALQGRPTMLVFWASWCGPCRQEAPEVARIVEGYGEKLHVVSINAGEDPSTAARAAQSMGITWPVGLDLSGAIQSSYDVQAIPLVLILDAEGIIRFRGLGLPGDAHRILDGLTG
ncbi:MAG: cytochrome c biogenesis protein CcmG/thiol:disulfide interchange protein DsbE [Myxococcota bacterium]|jgi:cytochrome c biogenesis protein CcmG/thiol:disulfide interchange protein DsbE